MNRDRHEREGREHRSSPQQPRGDRQQPEPMSDLRWVVAVIRDGDYASLDEKAKELGNRLADDASKTQVRLLFGTVKRLELLRDAKELDKQLAMLRPRLAYAASRAEQLNLLKDVLTEATRQVQENSRERTTRLVDLMEAIFCYSRAAIKMKDKAR